jgi:hypothetical protein
MLPTDEEKLCKGNLLQLTFLEAVAIIGLHPANFANCIA